jgi:serine/threonine protein kinase
MNKYTETKRIKATRFSDIYTARLDDRPVVLKVTTPDEERPPHCSRDEIRLLKELNGESEHANITTLLDTYVQDLTDSVLVFPLYAFTLTDLLRHHSKRMQKLRFNPYLIDRPSPAEEEYTSTLEASTGIEIVKGIANGLSFLHSQSVIHRDIKPDNIMFQGYNPVPIIIDFGISYKYPNNYGKENPEKKICDVSTGMYKAPELLFSIADYSYGVDIWALGIVMTLIFSEHVKPIFDEEDLVDFKLMGMIFSTFGVPSLKGWPEAARSPSFVRLQLTEQPGRPADEILPRAPKSVRSIFQKMMVYDSSKRLHSSEIYNALKNL